MMIDHLQEVLPRLQHFPPEMQEEIANHIEALEQEVFAHDRMKEFPQMASSEEPWEDPAGSLSDLPDDMFEELDKIRHANPPSPPLELP